MNRFVILFFLVPFSLLAQERKAFKFVDGDELTLSGQSALVSPGSYRRIDSVELLDLPGRVRELAGNTAGINLMFQTNSKSITVKWALEEYRVLWNMTPLAASGLDLYGWNGKSWQYVASARPSGTHNSATFVKNLDGAMCHYKVYLPLYATLTAIEIGIEEDAVIKPADKGFSPSGKVVIYGSSITQGASASRPGMAYPSILSRKLNLETFNLGFSGSGKMEIEMADILGHMAADLYILDCVPNPSPEQIKNRAVPFIKRLRDLQPQTPIVMVESIFRETGHWDAAIRERVTQQNKAFSEAYRQLIGEGFEDLYYIPSEELTGDDHEATVDGTHLSDIGQAKMAGRIGRAIVEIVDRQTP